MASSRFSQIALNTAMPGRRRSRSHELMPRRSFAPGRWLVLLSAPKHHESLDLHGQPQHAAQSLDRSIAAVRICIPPWHFRSAHAACSFDASVRGDLQGDAVQMGNS
jgi:hypothetical protein